MKYAFLVICEIRCIKKIENIYKYIIDKYNADIIICCQELEDTYEKLKSFEKNQVFKKVYAKKDPKEYYNNYKLGTYPQQNWNNEACLQIYINWNEMADVLENYKDDYDYFIQLRTDIDILFPFPDTELFESISKGIYSFDAIYAKDFGGYCTGVFIHKNYILKYLKCTYNILKDDNIINLFINSYNLLNQENFKNFCMKYNDIEFKYINNLNIFFIAENLNTRTTWGTPQQNEKYDGVIKEKNQFEEAYNNLELWNKGYRWVYENNCIMLKNYNYKIE